MSDEKHKNIKNNTMKISEAENRYQALIEHSMDGFYLHDIEIGRFLYANKKICEISGFSKEEILASEVHEMVPDEEKKRVTSLITELVNGKKLDIFEMKMKRKDGSVYLAEVSAVLVEFEGRLCNQGTVRDITERRKTETILKERDVLLSSIAKSSNALLSSTAISESINKALKILGEAVGVDRVYIFENSNDRETKACFTNQRYEWARDSVTAEINNPELQNLPYYPKLKRWYEVLRFNKVIKGLVKDFPDREKEILQPQGIQSILVVPIMIKGKFWGFVGFDDCIGERVWEDYEISILLAGASNIGNAIVRSRYEEALNHNQIQLRQIIDMVPHPIFVKDKNDKFLLVNNATADFYGTTVEKLTGVLQQDIHKDRKDAERFLKYDKEVINSKITKFIPEEILVNAKSERRMMQITMIPFVFSGAPETVVLGVAVDITERKKIEEVLRKTRKKFKDIAENAFDWIWEVDKKGMYTYSNASIKKVLGFTPKEVVGKKHFYDFFHPEDKEVLKKQSFEMFKERHLFRGFINRNIRRDGKIVWVSTSGVPVLGKDGELLGYRGADTDITERKKVEEFKDEILKTVSHELRTPLSIAREGIALILDGTVSEKSEQNKILEISKKGMERLTRLINDLLDMSKIESGKMNLNKENVNLKSLVKNVMSEFNQKKFSRKVKLKVKVPKDRVFSYVDPDRISQVIMNLVGNSIKFTAKGYIEISIVKKKKEVICSVGDTGIGISKEDLPKAFEKFQQFGRMTGPGDKGTGLGLSIAKAIIDMHEGKIWVKSVLGKGTTFSFSVPGIIDN